MHPCRPPVPHGPEPFTPTPPTGGGLAVFSVWLKKKIQDLISGLAGKITKVPNAPTDNLVVFGTDGELKDSGIPLSDFHIVDDKKYPFYQNADGMRF